ncbi:hypothetical protein SEUCBS140593_002299 [Sporothrix eucalyptigena]|uniref:NACHT domain-containing protein n=1 Tax=Sporothrix eucalyptigena TaxID=1812306 RepID=A0ABP0B642_9PEZI
MATVTADPVLEAFDEARRVFVRNLKNQQLYREIRATKSVNDVYAVTTRLQESRAGQGRLRNMGKIKRFLDNLTLYVGVIEQFVSAKPELLALIWGPIKLLLMWSNEYFKIFDKITDILEEIGHFLPQFDILKEVLEGEAFTAAMVLFFEDMLSFYLAMLNFFTKTKWKQIFDLIWPKHRVEIDLIVKNLQKHVNLIRSNATVLEIQDARKARNEARDHYERAFAAQEHQNFVGLKERIAAELYDKKLDWFRYRSVANCAEWLFQNGGFVEWLDSTKTSVSWFWLQGIPGAGKTYLAAAAIDNLKQQHRTLFAFASYLNKNSLTALSVIQSFIFQAAEADREFQSDLVESKERELKGNTGYAANMLKSYVKMADGPTYIVMDGLDEMDEDERQILLWQLSDLAKHCPRGKWYQH